MEEHVLTTNLVLDKSGAAGLALWIISLDLSKAFDAVNWETLWEALGRQNIFKPIDLDFTVPLLQSNRSRSRWCW